MEKFFNNGSMKMKYPECVWRVRRTCKRWEVCVIKELRNPRKPTEIGRKRNSNTKYSNHFSLTFGTHYCHQIFKRPNNQKGNFNTGPDN